jgi:hypothetical protein
MQSDRTKQCEFIAMLGGAATVATYRAADDR